MNRKALKAARKKDTGSLWYLKVQRVYKAFHKPKWHKAKKQLNLKTPLADSCTNLSLGEAQMLRDSSQLWAWCWVWFPGKELEGATLPALCARCLYNNSCKTNAECWFCFFFFWKATVPFEFLFFFFPPLPASLSPPPYTQAAQQPVADQLQESRCSQSLL